MTDRKAEADDWVAIRFEWLARVAAETHEWLPLAVATLIAGRYLNSQTRDTWVSADTLADELNTDRRNVGRALDKLTAARLLGRQRGGRGGRNYYWIPDRVIRGLRAPSQKRLKRRDGASQKAKMEGSPSPPNPRGTREEPEREAANAAPPSQDPSCFEEEEQQEEVVATASKRKRSRRASTTSAQTSFPTDWKLGDLELDAALQIMPSWDDPQVQDQFEAFRDWYLAKGLTSADWLASWRKWCRSGRDHANKQNLEGEPITGLRSVGLGLETFVRKHETKH